MKNMKKALALLLAAVMLLAMSAVAMAATPTGSITVNNLEQWEKVDIYQIIEMPFDEGKDQYGDVQWTSEMQDWLDANNNTLKPTEAPTSGQDNDTDKLYQDLYAAIKAGTAFTVVKNGQVTTTTDTSLTFDGLTAGSYMVIVSGGAKEHQPYVVSLKPEFVNNSAWEISAKSVDASKKASEPTIDKTVSKDNVSITDTVTFTIKTSVPKYADNATDIKYWISDEMDEGLTYDPATLVVKGDNTVLTAGTDYEVESYYGTPANGRKGLFTLKFTYANIKDYANITVTYNATVNDDIVVGATDNDNKAIFDYTNGSKDDTEYVYTYGIEITKEDAEHNKLAGAEFVLKDEKGNELTFVKDSNGIYKLSTDSNASATLVSEAGTGLIKIDGLAEGKYTLVETKAPDGYNLLRAPTDITLTKDSNTKYWLSGKTSAYDEQTVVNSKGMNVPSTGGMGTTIFMVAGIVIMACAVVTLMMLLKRQKSGSEG